MLRSILTRAITMLLAAVLALALGGDARADRTRELGLADMARRAGRIFYGECIDRVVVEPDGGVRPYTTYSFAVIRSIKGGDEAVATFSVSGAPDGRGFAGMPVFEIGQRSLLLLYPPGPRGLTSPMGLDQGYFRVLEAPDGGELLLNGHDNRRLFADVPARWLGNRAIDVRRAGPVRLEALEGLLRSLAQEDRP